MTDWGWLMGTVLAQPGNAAYPSWERCLPILGTLLAPVGQNCSQTSVQ